MKRLIYFIVLIFLACSTNCIYGQFPSDLSKQIQSDLPQWRSLITIHIEDLQVSYEQGKVIEKTIDALKSNLDLASLIVSNEHANPKLSNEILLVSVLTDIESGLQVLSANVLDFGSAKITQQPKWNAWVLKTSATAANEISPLQVKLLNSVLDKAERIEGKKCN